MSWFDLPRKIRETLLANNALAAIVSGRVHYQTIPPTSQLPHVWFARQGVDEEDMLGEERGLVVERYSVEIIDTKLNEDLVDAVVTALQAVAGEVGEFHVDLVDVEDAGDEYVFKSLGDGYADFLHALQVSFYLL